MSPTFTQRANGFSLGIPGPGSGTTKRTEVKGWTPASARRNAQWLQSIDVPSLTGTTVHALTLTLPICPPHADDYKRKRERLFRHLRNLEPGGFHWLTEWTARKVPHLHMTTHGLNDSQCADLLYQWASDNDGVLSAQHYAPMTTSGWLEYVAKHGSRGARHYQRNGAPEGWQKTGRMWGHGGDWPISDPMVSDIDDAFFYRLRRLVRQYDAQHYLRHNANPKQAVYKAIQRGPAPNDVKRSSVAGGAWWLDSDTLCAFLDILDLDVPFSYGNNPDYKKKETT